MNCVIESSQWPHKSVIFTLILHRRKCDKCRTPAQVSQAPWLKMLKIHSGWCQTLDWQWEHSVVSPEGERGIVGTWKGVKKLWRKEAPNTKGIAPFLHPPTYILRESVPRTKGWGKWPQLHLLVSNQSLRKHKEQFSSLPHLAVWTWESYVLSMPQFLLIWIGDEDGWLCVASEKVECRSTWERLQGQHVPVVLLTRDSGASWGLGE